MGTSDRPAKRVVLGGPPGLISDALSALLDTAGHAVSRLEHGEGSPDVVVLVEPRPQDWDAAEQTSCRDVVVVVNRWTETSLYQAIRGGAHAVLDFGDEPDELRRAVELVAAGEALIPPDRTRVLLEFVREGDRGIVKLTRRELDILGSIAKGEVMKQTARSLGVAERTVQNAQSGLFRKLNVRNRAQAIAKAHALGIIPD